MEERRVAIYSRKSRFTGKGESIGNQGELCRGYVKNLWGEAEAERCVLFEDEGFSGGDLNRPDFQRMMTQVRAGRFRAILVYRLDRISRNISDFTGLIDELTRLDVAFISIREQFDTSTPMGRAMMFIISVFSQLERETIAQRIRDNMHELAKTGRWLGGNAPIGFRAQAQSRVTVEGKARKSSHLALLPEEAEIPKLIFDLYTQTDSLTAVEAELLRRRVKTRQGKDFTRFAIRGILRNPVYLTADGAAYRYFLERGGAVCCPEGEFDGTRGILAYNRTDQEKGRTTVPLPISEWIIAIGQHPGLIPSAQWIAVQKSLERNKSKAYRKPRQNEALLTGLIFCACGSRMYPRLTQRKTGAGELVYTYVCKGKERSKGELCRCPNANGNALDDTLLAHIAGLPEDDRRFRAQLEKSRSFLTAAEPAEDRGMLEGKLEENEKIISGLIDSLGLAGDSAARPRILERIEALSEASEAIHRRLRALADPPLSDTPEPEFLGRFSRCVEAMTTQEKRAALQALVRQVVWDGGVAHVTLIGEEERPDTRSI